MVFKKITILIILLLANVHFTYSQGVLYSSGTIGQALQKAAEQDKLLLVEFLSPRNYRSTWMNNMMNTSKDVTEKLNNEFVTYQFNTKSSEGAGFAVTYSVSNYPTIIIFNQNGDAISKIEQNMDPKQFIEHLDQVLFNTNGAAVWRIQQILTAADNLKFEEIAPLFQNLVTRFGDQLKSKHFWSIFQNNTITHYYTPAFGYLIKNFDEIRQNVDTVTVDKALESKLNEAVMNILTSGYKPDTLIVNDLKTIVDSTISATNPLFSSAFAMIQNKIDGDAGHYLIHYAKLRNLMNEDSGFNLALSLDFIADIGTREQKQRAKRLLEQEMLFTSVDSQIQMLQNLINRF